MPHKVTLATVVSIIVTVPDAADEDAAIDLAYQAAREFGDQWHSGKHGTAEWTVGVNNEWQYEDPTVEQI